MELLDNTQFQAHCRNHFYREFAWKTVIGMDQPNKDGKLLDARRARTNPIKNTEQLLSTIKRYKRPGKYVTVFSFERLVKEGDKKGNGELYAEYLIGKGVNYESAKINRIYFDFDNEQEPQKAINEALMVVRSLVKHGIYCHCYFSGKKGIGLYIEFKTLNIKPENKKDVLKLFLDTMIGAVKTDFNHELTTIDYKVSFDLARVSRIPNTQHKSGLYCIPVSFGDMRKGIDHIKIIAQEPSGRELDDIITKCMMRNERMQTIMTNLEKQVGMNREYNIKASEIKKNHFQKIKRFMVNMPGALTDEQITIAKNVPMSSIVSNEERQRCPIHGGDNPTSFYINHAKNYWYCFSCNSGGTAIDFIMHKNKVAFKEAVLILNK